MPVGPTVTVKRDSTCKCRGKDTMNLVRKIGAADSGVLLVFDKRSG